MNAVAPAPTFVNQHQSAAPARCAGYDLTHLSDSDLLNSTRRVIGRSNQLLAELLAHLAEVESRGIHRSRACSTLTAYCIYELRLSEDAASRRVTAAKLVRRFPALLDAIASGELHLTGLLLLGPHLTDENHEDVLARGKHRTKKEIEKLVRVLDPLPDVPARIEPLGPALAAPVHRPTWEHFVSSLCPIRELRPGERPRDWMTDATGETEELSRPCEPLGSALARVEPANVDPKDVTPSCSAPARSELTPVTGPQRFHVQFMADQEYVELVERAQALLSHALPHGDLAEIQLRAMRALVAGLEKAKYGAPTRTQVTKAKAGAEAKVDAEDGEAAQPPLPRPEAPSFRGRHIPAAVRRAVRQRDGDRCTYVDLRGQRCRETHYLEFHHLQPFAKRGLHTAENLTLRCRAHNTLAAEEVFGREVIQQKKGRLEPK